MPKSKIVKLRREKSVKMKLQKVSTERTIMKKALTTVAALALALSLSACAGGSAANQTSNTANQNSNASASQSTATLSDEAFNKLTNDVNSILDKEWENYGYASTIKEKEKTIIVYISAPAGTKDRLTSGTEDLRADWETIKQDIIKQNDAIEKAAAATLPGVQATTYVIEGLDFGTASDAITNGTYNPTNYLLLVKGSTVEYDCVKS